MWSSQTGTCLYQAKGGKKGITQFCGQTIWNHEKQTNKKNTSTHRDNVSDILSCCSSLTIWPTTNNETDLTHYLDSYAFLTPANIVNINNTTYFLTLLFLLF